MSGRAPLIACIAVLAFFAGITGVRLAYTLAYVLAFMLLLAFAWSRAVARRVSVTRESPSGVFMVGAYHMLVPSSGENFDVAIPAFSLDSPHQSGRVH